MRCCKFLSVLLLIILIFSCASAPDEDVAIPGWFANPPSESAEKKYFAVSVQAPVIKDIEELAGEAFFQELLTFIGISGNESELEDLADFKNEVTGLVQERSFPGFSLIEKQINRIGSDNIIFLLIEMDLAHLEILKDRLADLFKAGNTASIFSDSAADFVEQGELFRGAVSYVKAAIESAESDNSFITEKNLSSAIEQLEKMKIEKKDFPESIAVGENGIFSAFMNSDTGGENLIWSNVYLKVSFRDRKKGSVIGERFALLRTDENGIVTFVHPSPGFTGKGRVEISLDLFRDLDSLEMLETKYGEKLEELKNKAEAVQVRFDFDIISSAPFVPTGVFIVDSDFLRKPLDTFNTAEGVLNSLSDADFNVDQLNINHDSILKLSEEEFLRDLPYMVDSVYKRVIFGVAQITDFDDSAAGFTVVTEANLKVVELDTGEILFDENLSKRVQGGESQSTINTSFKELGKGFSSLLIDKLP